MGYVFEPSEFERRTGHADYKHLPLALSMSQVIIPYFSHYKKPTLSVYRKMPTCFSGASGRTRTADLVITNHSLYRLSHGSIFVFCCITYYALGFVITNTPLRSVAFADFVRSAEHSLYRLSHKGILVLKLQGKYYSTIKAENWQVF